MRLDVRMAELNLAPSREKARALVMAGKVSVDGKGAQKPGMDVKEASNITVAQDAIPFVSRGGLKLQKAFEAFDISVEGLVAADIGASTGGFTDCMLQHGARKVYALDVGYGQLDWRLRNDPRVVVMERTNARHMEPAWFAERPEFASMDVSFISIRLILPALHACLREGGVVASLIKPQFEAGRSQVQKHGVIRDAHIHEEVIERILTCAVDTGFDVCALDFSPVTGPKGNIEFLVKLQKAPDTEEAVLRIQENCIKNIVDLAHTQLL